MSITIDNVETRGEQDPLPNPSRGCGHLKPGKAYLVGAGFSPDGVLPTWVELDPPLPFREVGTSGEFTRGFQAIDGLTLQLALEDHITEFVEHYPDELHDGYEREELLADAMQNHVKAGVFDDVDDVPLRQSDRHIARVRARGELYEGDAGAAEAHWGNIPIAEQTDLLMRAGASYYPSPEDYATETTRHGLSKAIPLTATRDPPEVVTGVTRCWIMHPKACEGFGGGIIGFAYLSEVAFTEPEEGSLPEYVEEYAELGDLSVRPIDEPSEPGAEDETPDAEITDFDE